MAEQNRSRNEVYPQVFYWKCFWACINNVLNCRQTPNGVSRSVASMKRDSIRTSFKVIESLLSPLNQDTPSTDNHHSQLSNIWWNHWQISDALVLFTPFLIHAGIIRFLTINPLEREVEKGRDKKLWRRRERKIESGEHITFPTAAKYDHINYRFLSLTRFAPGGIFREDWEMDYFFKWGDRCRGNVDMFGELPAEPRRFGTASDKYLIKSIFIITAFLFQ